MRLVLVFLVVLTFKSYSQGESPLDFTHLAAVIKPNSDRSVSGTVHYSFQVKGKATSIAFDAVDMEFSNFYLGNAKLEKGIHYDGKVLQLAVDLAEGNYQIQFDFYAKPKQTVYFMGWGDKVKDNEQIWTQGQGKYTSHWLPSFDTMTEKFEFDLSVQVPPEYQVVANGVLKRQSTTDELTTWEFDMDRPMSSYLAAFVVGHFEKKVIHSSSGVPIELYYAPGDSTKVEPTYRYTKAIFDFLEAEIGVPYPWQIYKQVPVQDFLYAGMENTSCTVFSNQYVIDSTAFIDKNYVNINAHELAHQWFGNMVTEFSGDHHWLHEGFATYYAYLAEKELFGDTHFYWRLYQTAKTLANLSENGDGEALTDPNANSLTFYEKGALALVMLRERVGDTAFRNGIKSYLKNYAFKNAMIADFIQEMAIAADEDLSDYRKEWLESEEFPWEQVKSYFEKKEPSLKQFFELKEVVGAVPEATPETLQLFNSETPVPLKRQFILEFHQKIPEASLADIIATGELEVRQAVALSIPKVTKDLQDEFEAMLEDQSYVTQETVLYKLWEVFPENRETYLDRLKGTTGLPNKNIRLLWLTLSLITPEYQPDNKKEFYDALNDYTAPRYNFEIRLQAFKYLFLIRAFSNTALENLIQASESPVWQFKKASRKLLKTINTTEEGKEQLRNLRQQLTTHQLGILNKVLAK